MIFELDLASYIIGVLTTGIILLIGFWIDDNFRPRPPRNP